MNCSINNHYYFYVCFLARVNETQSILDNLLTQLGGVKKGGLGAQKVKKDFAEVENAAKEMEKLNATAPRVAKTPQEEEKEMCVCVCLKQFQ